VEGGMGCVDGRRIEVQLQFCLKSDNKTYAWLLNWCDTVGIWREWQKTEFNTLMHELMMHI